MPHFGRGYLVGGSGRSIRRLQVRFLCGAPQVEIWLQAMQDDALESAIPQIGPSYDLLPPTRLSDYNDALYLRAIDLLHF